MEQRIIKFKAKRLDNNEWITGDLLQMSEKDVQIYNKDCGGSDHPVNPSTVCQFTGLKDKNNIPVYENDIIADTFGATYVVEWNPFICKFYVYNIHESLGGLLKSLGWKVVGNKFDRKEEK